MNVQKDLIQHIAVLGVVSNYLNFAQRRSSDILHVGLEETKQLLRDCLAIMAAEDRTVCADISASFAREDAPPLAPYARAFRLGGEQIDALSGRVWDDDLDVRYDMAPIINGLDQFLNEEHWYDMDRAQLLRAPDGSFYCDCSPLRANFVPNWRCASLFFSEETTDWTREALRRRYHQEAQAVSLLSLAPPQGYLWMARTYAPQSPQNLINYWEAMLPGARRARIRQMVSQQQNV